MDVETYLCPGCDQEVPVGSRGCPRCNPPSRKRKRYRAAAQSRKPGWKSAAHADGLDLADEPFDYESYVAREFGGNPHRRLGITWYWWVTGILLLGLCAAGAIGLLRF